MTALLLIAHGSRRAESNDEIRALTAKLKALAGSDYTRVECAFLELAEPGIETSIDQLIADGQTDILCLPYFLARGAHVASDIPEALEEARLKHPSATISASDYLGAADQLPGILMHQTPWSTRPGPSLNSPYHQRVDVPQRSPGACEQPHRTVVTSLGHADSF